MNFKVGVQYKFINREAEEEFAERYTMNKDFVYEINDNGHSFIVTKVNPAEERVVEIMWANGTQCDEIGANDLVIFDSEYRFFIETGIKREITETELVMTLVIHNRSQAMDAVNAIKGAYNC